MAEASWELQATESWGQAAAPLLLSSQTPPVCQADGSECGCVCVCVCPCACAWVRAWACAFEGPGAGRAAEGGPPWLRNPLPPRACSARVGPAEVPGKPVQILSQAVVPASVSWFRGVERSDLAPARPSGRLEPRPGTRLPSQCWAGSSAALIYRVTSLLPLPAIINPSSLFSDILAISQQAPSQPSGVSLGGL